MQQGRQLILGVLLILAGILLADTSFAAVTVTKPTESFHVTDLKQEGVSRCDGGTWSFEISWKPIIYKNQPWQIYNISSLAGSIHDYKCTPERCLGQFSGMHNRQKTAYAKIQAASVGSVSGMEISGIPYFQNCK